MSRPYDSLFSRFKGERIENEPLSRHTSLKVGGPADMLAIPEDVDDLQGLIAQSSASGIAWMVIGGGYNLLVRDLGFRGIVISLKRLRTFERLAENRIRVQAGMPNQRLVKCLEVEGLSGLEFLSGIPGSVGGALAMNAGCHGYEIMDRLETLTTVNANGVTESGAGELEYGYRYVRVPGNSVIVAARFHLAADDPTAIAVRNEEFLEKRRVAQKVTYPNAGSFFKNPPAGQAWRLIDAAGLRGRAIGGAQVSEQHANFLVNRGGATASDFLELARVIKERVKAATGVDLEEEVRIVGEE